jgi:hypothetical protein
LISKNVILNENEIYFNINKSSHKINYNLYDNNEYYFFDISLAKSDRIMLLNDFESIYVSYLRQNNYVDFVTWYETLYKPIDIGSQYVKKKYIFEGRNKKILHDYHLPNFMKKDHVENKNFSMSFVTVVSTLSDIPRLSITINSLRNQIICDGMWNLIIIVNNNFGHQLIHYDDKFIKIIQLNKQIIIGECYDIAVNNTKSEILTFIKPGIIINPCCAYTMLEAYNNSSICNVFIYPTSLDDCVLNHSDSNFNKYFVSIKKEYYAKITNIHFVMKILIYYLKRKHHVDQFVYLVYLTLTIVIYKKKLK